MDVTDLWCTSLAGFSSTLEQRHLIANNVAFSHE